MQRVFADLHVHIGRSGDGRPVKISAAPGMTVEQVLRECMERKGIHMVAVVDAASPGVQADIERLIQLGKLSPVRGGGLRYVGSDSESSGGVGGTVLLPAVELEVGGEGTGPAHYVSYFPDMAAIAAVARTISRYVSNVHLSTQNVRLTAKELLHLTEDNGGLFVPAHVFTPHKGFYGICAPRLTDVFGAAADRIVAVELGLSADSAMADRIDELADRAFLSSSDAHSLPKIAREYTEFSLPEPSFAEMAAAIRGRGKGRITANYGLDPRLGKYHRSGCKRCGAITTSAPPVTACPACGGDVVKGVLDRLTEIADRDGHKSPRSRPPYIHQVPLEFVPGIGPKTLDKLISTFGSEMAVLHDAAMDELAPVVGEAVARRIVMARSGQLMVQSGGGGTYGTVYTHGDESAARHKKLGAARTRP